jgi:hypothetical protein
MTKNTKLIIGVIAIAGIGYYLYNRNKKTQSNTTAMMFDGDYDNAGGSCGGANGSQSNCPPCHRCLNGQCTQLPPSVCRFTPSSR